MGWGGFDMGTKKGIQHDKKPWKIADFTGEVQWKNGGFHYAILGDFMGNKKGKRMEEMGISLDPRLGDFWAISWG